MAASNRFVNLGFYLPAFALSAWGVTLLHTVFSGRLVTLLHPFFRPLVLVAGILLLILSVAHLCFFRPPPDPELSERGWKTTVFPIFSSLFLTLPLLYAAAYAPMGFSENALEARGLDSNLNLPAETDDDAQRLLQAIEKLKPGEAVRIDLPDLATAATVSKLVQVLEGRDVRVPGQFHSMGADQFKVFRLLMFCCAADAVPLSVTVKGTAGPDLKDGNWVEVEGSVRFVKSKDSLVPEVELRTIHRIEAPADPYVY
jgi:uncharacterized repeat protein (TIGR03943 family)